MLVELVDARVAVEKLRTVNWADQAAATHGDHTAGLFELHTLVEATLVDAVGALDASKEHKVTGDLTAAAHLRRRCRARDDTTKRLQRAARNLRTMPHTAEAFAAAEITLDHVEVLAKANTPKLADQFARDEEELLDHARALSFDRFYRQVQKWKDAEAPDDEEDRAANAEDDRRVHLSKSFGGQGFLDGLLTRLGFHVFNTELERRTKRLLDADWADARARLGDTATALDLARTPAQRRHDALIEMAEAARAHDGIAPGPDLGTTVVCDHATYMTAFARIVARIMGTDPDQHPYPHQRRCEWANGDPATPEQAVWYSLAGWIDVMALDPNGRPLNHSRTHRIFTPAQRRAAKIAFPTCTHDSCPIRSVHCELDHVLAWIDDGPTDIVNADPNCKGHNLWKEWARKQARRRRFVP